MPRMELSALGNESEGKTEIRLGTDPKIKETIETISARIKQLKTKGSYFASKLKEIEMSQAKSKGLFEKLIEKMENIMEAQTTLDINIGKLEQAKKSIEKTNKIISLAF